jgi:hypothetical protein
VYGEILLCAAMGRCSTAAKTIRLNTEQAKKLRVCVQYIVVHESVHPLEPKKNARFIALMDYFMSHWKKHRAGLNRLSVRHGKGGLLMHCRHKHHEAGVLREWHARAWLYFLR